MYSLSTAHHFSDFNQVVLQKLWLVLWVLQYISGSSIIWVLQDISGSFDCRDRRLREIFPSVAIFSRKQLEIQAISNFRTYCTGGVNIGIYCVFCI